MVEMSTKVGMSRAAAADQCRRVISSWACSVKSVRRSSCSSTPRDAYGHFQTATEVGVLSETAGSTVERRQG